MMDVPTELKISPMVASLLDTLDWKHDPLHWWLLQQIVMHDPALSAQVLRVDPTVAVKTDERVEEKTFVPTLAKSAQLADKLLAASEIVGLFHHDCLTWLHRRSPMPPSIFLESVPCGQSDWSSPAAASYALDSAKSFRTFTTCGSRRPLTTTKARD
jgi:hypothetical protein